jgi:hypothetical protein
MSLTLSEKEKRAAAALIQERLDEQLSRFPFARYPIEPLEAWKQVFCDPKTVPAETLRRALSWCFGGWARKGLASAQSRTIFTIIKAWPEFAESTAPDPAQAFRFWEQKLPDWKTGFNATAFLLHLTRHDAFELADAHRISAMNELLKTIGQPETELAQPLSFASLERYSQFFRLILPKLPYGHDSRVMLDRFLKAYGNRHAYRNVAADYRTKEPTIREFSWEKASSERFDLGKIRLRSNADVLFACLLLSLERQNRADTALTIGQIADLIPLGTSGICNPASYNYAMIALFGGQKGRDYFQFENASLQEAFTEQANRSTRDMKFYVKHADEAVTINPKYINQS